ncbi:SURF1 family protein, partial [Azospirillum brasilense]|nr:SURF1 family protein [Azospirillum brasilense]
MTAAAEPRRFRPSLWATLITVPAVLVMLGLGTWQMHRPAGKEDLFRRGGQRLYAPPTPRPPPPP